MALWENVNRQVRNFAVLELKLAQAAAVFFALVVVKLFPQITALNIWWFIALAILCATRPVYVFFQRR